MTSPDKALTDSRPLSAAQPAAAPSTPKASSRPTTRASRLVAFRSRFAFGQLRRRRFWPFWLGLALIALSLGANWTASSEFSALGPCYNFQAGCWSGSKFYDYGSGGYGPGMASPAAIAIWLGAFLWASARRDLPRPAWFGNVPRALLASALVVLAVNLPQVLPTSGFEVDTSLGTISGGQPAWGTIMFALGIVALWRGMRRVRLAFDSATA
jgi:hypothetical protein